MSLEPIAGRPLIYWAALTKLPAVAEALGDDPLRPVSLRSHLQRAGVLRPDGAIDLHRAGEELPRWQKAYEAIHGTLEQRRMAQLNPQARGHARRRQQQQTRQRPGWQPAGGYVSDGGEP